MASTWWIKCNNSNLIQPISLKERPHEKPPAAIHSSYPCTHIWFLCCITCWSLPWVRLHEWIQPSPYIFSSMYLDTIMSLAFCPGGVVSGFKKTPHDGKIPSRIELCSQCAQCLTYRQCMKNGWKNQDLWRIKLNFSRLFSLFKKQVGKKCFTYHQRLKHQKIASHFQVKHERNLTCVIALNGCEHQISLGSIKLRKVEGKIEAKTIVHVSHWRQSQCK